MAMQLVKVVLRSGKTVYLRMMQISDTEKAAQKVSAKAGGDSNVLQILMQKALVQLLLVKMAAKEGDKPEAISGVERENLDALFTIQEYSDILKVVGKMSGADEPAKDLPLEMVEE